VSFSSQIFAEFSNFVVPIIIEKAVIHIGADLFNTSRSPKRDP
jgi:hypothetical protein